jgi:hypothetical protein
MVRTDSEQFLILRKNERVFETTRHLLNQYIKAHTLWNDSLLLTVAIVLVLSVAKLTEGVKAMREVFSVTLHNSINSLNGPNRFLLH